MAATLSATVSAAIQWTLNNAVTGLSNNSQNANTLSFSNTLANGTGASGTANLIYASQASIAGGANTTITFSSGLTDFFGNSIVFARIKFLFANLLTSTGATSINIGNATHALGFLSGTSPVAILNNGGMLLIGDQGGTGYACTVNTTDQLKISNQDGTNTATVNIVAIGSTA